MKWHKSAIKFLAIEKFEIQHIDLYIMEVSNDKMGYVNYTSTVADCFLGVNTPIMYQK